MTAFAAILSLAGAAWAQTPPTVSPPPRPPDLSLTSVGLQTWTSSSLSGSDASGVPGTDVDLSVGERLRWTLLGDPDEATGTDWLGLVDARFTIDPTGPDPLFEWSQVRQAGFEMAGRTVTLDVGRHPVYRGGPRLVDGLQLRVRPVESLDVGLWAGLAPDLFTTLPELRPGGGPIVSWSTSRLQASMVGEVLLFDGALDRVGVLTMVRAAAERALEGTARLDLEVVGPLGTRIVDLQLTGVGQPVPALRLDALYDAFSSYRYVGSDLLDPDLQRFAVRIDQLGLVEDIQQDVRDDTLNHLVGLGARVQPDTEGAAPRVGLMGRYRTHPDPANRYLRINPQAGLVNLAQRLDLLLDGNYIAVDEGTQLDGGLMMYLEPVVEGPLAFDGSIRAVVDRASPDDPNEQLAGLGWYADFYVDVVSPELDLLLTGGVSVMTEPDVDQQDNGYGAYLRLSKYLRP